MKTLLKRALHKSGFEVRRTEHASADRRIRSYRESGSVPWSVGYGDAKLGYIIGALTNSQVMKFFENGVRLHDGFGVGFDERCIEYPWIFSQLNLKHKIILDAGSVLNIEELLTLKILPSDTLHIMTLSPENSCFWKLGVSYLYSDIRVTPIRDAFYDAVVCVSTLEHVGFDNRRYSHSDQNQGVDKNGFLVAMQEMNRILKSGGDLFLTVPFGVYRNYSVFQQFDSALLGRAIDAFGSAAAVNLRFYRYTASGWNIAEESECNDSEYVDWVAAVWQGGPRPNPAQVEMDRAAAARAVACVHLRKE